MEYLFLTFSNILVSAFLLAFLWIFLSVQELNYEQLYNILNRPIWRVIISISIATWISNIFFSIHIFYIISKTEIMKWAGFVAVILSVVPLFVIAIPFSILAYVKNEIAFE